MKNTIHFGRIIMYAILYFVTFSMYRFLHSHLFLMILIIMTAAPVLSILLLFFLKSRLSVEILAPYDSVKRGELSFVTLRTVNPSFVMSLDIKINLTVENIFYNSKKTLPVCVPTRMHKTYETMLPMRLSMNGVVRYSVDDIKILDILGFVEIKKHINKKCEVNIFPEISSDFEEKLSDMSRGMTESEETNKKGNDFSDVNDVREYIPGDKLMSIHWKLSAKRDILMVKDRVSMSDQQLVIVTELAGTPEQVDLVISLTYSICRKYIQEKIFVKLMWWSETRFEFVENQLLSLDNLQTAYTKLYYEKLYTDGEKTVEYMRSIKPELKAYVHVCQKEGEADVEICEQE